jgi:hypothetical protein
MHETNPRDCRGVSGYEEGGLDELRRLVRETHEVSAYQA